MTHTPKTAPTSGTTEPGELQDIVASLKMALDTTKSASSSSSTIQQPLLADLDDMPLEDICIDNWPWLPSPWNDKEVEFDWSKDMPGHSDAVHDALDTFADDRTGTRPTGFPLSSISTTLAPTQSSFPPVPVLSLDDSTTNDVEEVEERARNKYASLPHPVIGHLSQLSMRVTSLRFMSSSMAMAAEASSENLADGRGASLVYGTAFESVVSWLANIHGVASTNIHSTIQVNVANLAAQAQIPEPSPGSKPAMPPGRENTLSQVFSASQSLLEILHALEIDSAYPRTPSPVTAGLQTPSSSVAGPADGYFGIMTQSSSVSSTPLLPNMQSHCDMIINNFIMVCDSLLLEIYEAVVIALEHEIDGGDHPHGPVLGAVRWVLVIELCSHLIERQHQAVSLFLTSARSQNALNSAQTGNLTQIGPGFEPTSRERSIELKKRIQDRLSILRRQCDIQHRTI
ncbi:hypothetical protein INS49_006590 [Diaporthe citri]|uniref:uncharacterized protein n=1 Tax=Diaporthe citri TaxID=83186 RepID=UPI001C7E7883|nr:uncharacterized protein INS49_006590 [Diaporthe citri]KAG6364985.1 hypothetical protein INS49_006590 [Diaporthe citri]